MSTSALSSYLHIIVMQNIAMNYVALLRLKLKFIKKIVLNKIKQVNYKIKSRQILHMKGGSTPDAAMDIMH